eukprot:4110251-Prymnesium_polylepis.1
MGGGLSQQHHMFGKWQRAVVDPTFGVHSVFGRRPKPISEEFFGSTPLGCRENVTVKCSHPPHLLFHLTYRFMGA